jgi:hypothetical protein
MMMLAPILAGSALSSAAVASGAAAAGFGAIGGGAVAAGTGFSLASVLSAGFSAVSGLASIAKGNAEAADLRDKAAWADFNAARSTTKGQQDANAALRAGNDAIAAAQVAGFASGLAGSGSVTQAKLDASRDAQFNVNAARDAAAVEAGSYRGEAVRLRSDAGSARTAGFFNGFLSLARGFGRFAETG